MKTKTTRPENGRCRKRAAKDKAFKALNDVRKYKLYSLKNKLVDGPTQAKVYQVLPNQPIKSLMLCMRVPALKIRLLLAESYSRGLECHSRALGLHWGPNALIEGNYRG